MARVFEVAIKVTMAAIEGRFLLNGVVGASVTQPIADDVQRHGAVEPSGAASRRRPTTLEMAKITSDDYDGEN